MPSRITNFGRGAGQFSNALAAKAPAVPPGGFAGVQGQTAATLQIFRAPPSLRTLGIAVGRRRRRRKARTSTKRLARRRRTARPARFVKGSAAAKRYMAKLRRMRKRK